MVTTKTPVADLKMVGPQYVRKLNKLGISTVKDLLFHIPFRYQDFSLVSKIGNLQEGETVTISAVIKKYVNIYTKHGKKLQKLRVSDDTGEITVLFFNQPYLSSILKPGKRITIAGPVKRYIKELAFIAPQYEINRSENLLHTGRIVPVYPETEGLTSKWLRSRIFAILNKMGIHFQEFLPPEIINKYDLLAYDIAIRQIHFPDSLDLAENARKRLSFNELYVLQLASRIRKNAHQKTKPAISLKLDPFLTTVNKFIDSLPFQLTSAQKRAIDDIFSDLKGSVPANRILQGDVGSGKTIVALIASYLTHLNGYKTLFMAPTEILAKQHKQTADKFFSSVKIKTVLITGKEKPKSLEKIKKTANLFIGTHALLYQDFPPKSIAFVIIDEQQRFGVSQRKSLSGKSGNPHLLSTTATPIPRTVALTLYADQDMSIIDELPKGRLKVKTFVVPPEKRKDAYRWIEKEIKKDNQQAFIICPLIEESETLTTVKSAKKEYERLKENVFPNLNLGLIHGRLKTVQKNKIISDFARGIYDILVATPVVEVGIDIKNATIIMIEAADRFGLSQLHQLRGRVGRGEKQSYCLLFTENENSAVLKRLKLLTRFQIGIKLAEFDMKMRGPGEFFGTRQHGHLGLKFTDLSNLSLVKTAKEAADLTLTLDPKITRFPLLRQIISRYTIKSEKAYDTIT